LLYEANPLAFLVKEAGGLASDGAHDILDINPTELHQRTPLFIGSRIEIETAQAMLAGALAHAGA
jgi:fructose-1,6-bisphosphatase I